jgi:hypothetical protein
MAKRAGNPPVPGYFKVQGGSVEDRDAAGRAKSALGREAARRQRRAGRKTKLGAAPKEQRAKEPPKPKAHPAATVRAADREYARMNERRAPAPKRVKAAGEAEQPRYLSDTARGVIRRVARLAYTPVALARAVVDHFRERE